MNKNYETHIVCIKCNENKEIGHFSLRKKTGLVRRTICKLCHNEYVRAHYKKNKKQYLNRNNKYTDKIRAHIQEIKNNSECVDCGENNPIVLDFDHIKGIKKFGLAQARGSTTSMKKVKEEIDKCEIVCSNCHRIRTHYRRVNIAG